jgi:hypothetical protein
MLEAKQVEGGHQLQLEVPEMINEALHTFFKA